MRQTGLLYKVNSLSDLPELISELGEAGYLIVNLVTDKKHNEERGDYLEVLFIVIEREEAEMYGGTIA